MVKFMKQNNRVIKNPDILFLLKQILLFTCIFSF